MFKWWQTGIIYEIYPRSFQDSNGDGTGDLRGIISRLDYLAWLGVRAIWIAPVYPSPMADFGYDITDHTGIDPLFGDMPDFDDLVRAVHSYDLKMLMDFVPNHTSSLHPWFTESRSSRDNPKRDWYLWHNAKKDESPPNNWLAMFGGSAWEWDDKTSQYYYHGFLAEQPDLNWRNPEVRKAMYNIMRFWFDRGVDGFRVDALWHLIKDKRLRDNPVNPDYTDKMTDYDRLLPKNSTDQPEVFEIVREMRSICNIYKDRMIIGEAYVPLKRLVKYYGVDGNGCHLPANFMLILLPWEPETIAKAIKDYEAALPGKSWPNWVIGNHDQKRIASRIGINQAKNAAMLLLTLRGTPVLYYGDEMGMENVNIPEDEVMDPQGRNMPGKNLSRDPSRTPMQWSAEKNAGFTGNRPWLRLDERFRSMNVEAQKADPDSILSFYRRLIRFRNKETCLTTGSYEFLYADTKLLAFMRIKESTRFLVILNFTDTPCRFTTDKIVLKGETEISTTREFEGSDIEGEILIDADQSVIIRLTSSFPG
jgi:alpha-glucosidase